MFQGAHAHHTDEKGRLKVPADFARELGPSFTLTRAPSNCLWAMPAAVWAALVEHLRSDSVADPRMLALRRWFIGSAHTLSPDSQSRVTIPFVLRESAGIQREVMLVGIGDRVEVWARERWDAYEASRFSEEAIEEMARAVGL